MPEQIFIRPNDGRNVRLETGQLLPKDGMEVVHTTYVQRRINCGDAVVVERQIVDEDEE